MSRHKKTGKKQKALGDITLNDFANSTVSIFRAKKSVSNVNFVIRKLEEDNKAWDEKNDELEGDFVKTVSEDGTVSYVIKKSDAQHKKRTLSPNVEERTGNEYPLDIWFLISEYVKPEDVGRFAGICKSSYAVVHTAKFWFSLYKRCYKDVPNLPERLQPKCVLRLYGIRTSVIRALHYMYAPFVDRLRLVTAFERHPACLQKRQCVLMWYQRINKQWYYYFKLKENALSLLHAKRNGKKFDLIEMLEDVSANADDECRVLQVACEDFIAIPPVQGLTLTSVSMNLSHGLRHHRLQLWFGSGINCGTQKLGGSSDSIIVLDPVINVKVLDWWHPLYPHTSSIELLLNHD